MAHPDIELEIFTGPDGKPYLSVRFLTEKTARRFERDAAAAGMTPEEFAAAIVFGGRPGAEP